MKKYKLCIWICLLLAFSHVGIAKPSFIITNFSALATSQARIAYINQFFAQCNLAQYDSLLPIIQAQKDIATELFWHHRKHINLDIFSLTAAEKAQNLQEMRLKAQNSHNSTAELVADFHIDFLKYEQTRDSTVTLYYRNLKRFDKMKTVGLSQFFVYDLNMLLWKMGKDLVLYWQPEKGLDFLLIAEKHAQKDTVGQYYHTEVLSSIRTCYYYQWDYEPANAYSQKIIHIHQALNPTANPKQWWSLYWQARATFEIASLYSETLRLKRESYKAGKDRTDGRLCQVDTTQAIILRDIYKKKALGLYKQPFDLQTATRKQLMMEYEVLQELAAHQASRGELALAKVSLTRLDSIQKKLDFAHTEDFAKLWELYRFNEMYYLALNDYENSYKYKILMVNIENKLYHRNSRNQLEEMKQIHQIDKYSLQIETAEREKKQNLYIAIAATFLTIVISLGAYWVYYRIKKDNAIISTQKALLENSLAEKEMLLKEVHHRVKNNLQIISGLLEKQAMKTTDELTQKLIKEGQDRVFSIALVHQNLYQSENLSTIEIKTYLETLTQNIQQSHQSTQQEILLTLDTDTSSLTLDTAIPLGLILNELITNCYKYAFAGREKGEIKIQFHQKEGRFNLSVADNGIGLPPNLDIKRTRSLGLNLVNGLVRQLKGTLTFTSNENGTNFLIVGVH